MAEQLLPEMEANVHSTIRAIAKLDQEIGELEKQRKAAVRRIADDFKSRRSDNKTQRTNAKRGIEIQTRMKYEELVRLYGETSTEAEAVVEVGHEPAA